MNTEVAEIDLAEQMLKEARQRVLSNFEAARDTNKSESDWQSGILSEMDIKELQSNGDEVKTSVESGEYFYKIIFKSKKS